MSTAPLQRSLTADVPPVAITADGSTVIGDCPIAGTVTAVTYTPEGAVTGAASPASRTLSVVNRGQAGAGTTVVASLALVGGVDLVAYDGKPITLSVVADAADVAEGDVLEWRSVATTSATGLADPGGSVEVVIDR
jgi:hypothetical protein